MSDLARISLSEIGLVGHHGHHEAERELGQRFEVDVDLFVDIEVPGTTDNLADAVNYEDVYRVIERTVREDRYHLIEALAADLANTIFDEFDVEGVQLRIRKPSIPFCPDLGFVEIEVERGDVSL